MLFSRVAVADAGEHLAWRYWKAVLYGTRAVLYNNSAVLITVLYYTMTVPYVIIK